MHRLFVALRPPEPIRDTLLDLMPDSGEALRWQNEDQLHLTLRFIGEIERPLAEDLATALGAVRFKPFELRLGGVGRFARRSGGALWAGVAPREPLAALAAKVDRACVTAGLAPERRAYHPHLTLARWNGPEPNLAPFVHTNAGLSSDPWPADRFTLYQSHLRKDGAHYEAVAEYRADGTLH